MLSATLFGVLIVLTSKLYHVHDHVEAAQPHRILVDTDVDTDDVLALLYLLKQNRTEFDLQVNFFFPVYFDGEYITEVGATAGDHY